MAEESRAEIPKLAAEERDKLSSEISRLGLLVEEKEAELQETTTSFQTEISALETLKDEKQKQIGSLQKRLAKVRDFLILILVSSADRVEG